jgi:type IV secretion system protein VirB1
MINLLFITMCSTPGVHPETTREIIRHESGFQELALRINSETVTLESLGLKKPATKDEAAAIAQKLLDLRVNFDAGLMQVNTVNFKAQSLDVHSVFDPCKNIRAGTAILKTFYKSAKIILGPGQEALKAALSAYNTGSHSDGFGNGYVGKFYGKRVAMSGNPYKAGIISDGDLSRSRKDPYSASIIPANLDEGENHESEN